MLKILVMAALPEEYAYLRKITPRWRLTGDNPYRTFSFILPEKQVTLIETGMGGSFAADALKRALALSIPDLLIFAGFAGGLHESLSAGDVCAITHAVEYQPPDKPQNNPFTFVFPGELSDFLSERKVQRGWAVTVSSPPDKQRLAAFLAGGVGAVDMETAIIAGIARERGIAFLCLRAISDGVNDELGFDLKDITGERGNVVVAKVLKTILFNPAVIAAFYRSWKRSSKAGKNLGRIVADLLNLPAGTLKKIAAAARIELT